MRGNKLSSESMNKTMKLKLHKVDEINTARSELEMYSVRREIEELEATEKEFFRTHSRILRGDRVSQEKSREVDSNPLYVINRKPE